MKNKFSSLCIIASLLLGSSQVDAAYYFYQTQYVPQYAMVSVTPCCQSSSPCAVKHYNRCATRHHKFGHPSKHVKHSYYSITQYYVYSTPFGDAFWVPAPCCNTAWVNVRTYDDRVFYEPYGEVVTDDPDFDMDLRTADDVRE